MIRSINIYSNLTIFTTAILSAILSMDFLFPGFGVTVKYRSGNVQLALLLVIVRHLIMTLCVQMTAQETRLCGLLLQEHFGDVVEKVGTHLLKNGTQNLRTILHETGTSLNLVTA